MNPEEREHNGCVAYATAGACVVVALVILVLGLAPFAMPPISQMKQQWEFRWGIFLFNLSMASGLIYLAWRLVAPPKP